jgi:FlaA1/EpsC-like NDP-sugar epimerase
MIEPFNSKFLAPTKRFRRFSLLSTIHNSPAISQHKMGCLTHLSSSMVNNYIKEYQQEGLLTTKGNTNRTQTYHLTTGGQYELMSLLLEYSTEIIQLYGAAKRELTNRLLHIYRQRIRTVVLFGAAETAEVVFAAIKETPLKVKAVVDSDPKKQGRAFNDFIVQKPEKLKEISADAVVITSFAKQEDIIECIERIWGKGIRIVKLSDIEVSK